MLRITGGKVFDPANGIDGVVKDLCVTDGRIAPDVAGGRTIDASGMLVFPGGVDIHTHVAGRAVTFARTLFPEHQPETGARRITPTTAATGYLYAGMGWTTVNEAAMPMLSARQTLGELQDTPILDKTALLLLANNEIVLDLLKQGDVQRARDVVACLLWAAKAYGVKAVNPGGVASWTRGRHIHGVHEALEGFGALTPAVIITALAAIVDELGLRHPVHLHCNNLGIPGNVNTTIDTVHALEGNRAHFAHLQFHAYDGDGWSSIRSGSTALADVFNRSKTLTADAGVVLFGRTVTISADLPWQQLLFELTGATVGRIDVDSESGCGVVPYVYRDRNVVNAVQWAVGLELLLLIDDPWRIFLTTDHPNGAAFWRYPEIIHLLMDSEFRKEQIRKLPDKARTRIVLADLDREYSLREIAIITSAGPARALGLAQKGHLSVGADADIAIYPEHPANGLLFSYPRYVLKSGEIVVEDGHARDAVKGSLFLGQPPCDPAVEPFVRREFLRSYGVPFDDYTVDLDWLRQRGPVAVLPLSG